MIENSEERRRWRVGDATDRTRRPGGDSRVRRGIIINKFEIQLTRHKQRLCLTITTTTGMWLSVTVSAFDECHCCLSFHHVCYYQSNAIAISYPTLDGLTTCIDKE